METTAILTVYKRPHLLNEQIAALKSQTIPPKEIWVWKNGNVYLPEHDSDIKIIESSINFIFHARFALALLVKTKYVAIFDDDAIPGPAWFANCEQNFNVLGPCILCANGVEFLSNGYRPHKRYGSTGIHNRITTKVHIGHHSIVATQDVFRYMWGRPQISYINGDDIQFCCFAKLDAGIETFVPPHPISDRSVWGDTKPEYGEDDVASYMVNSNHYTERDRVLKECIKIGWRY